MEMHIILVTVCARACAHTCAYSAMSEREGKLCLQVTVLGIFIVIILGHIRKSSLWDMSPLDPRSGSRRTVLWLVLICSKCPWPVLVKMSPHALSSLLISVASRSLASPFGKVSFLLKE